MLLFVFALVTTSVQATPVCSASITAVAEFDPLSKLINCALIPDPGALTEAEYNQLYTSCLNPLKSAAGSSFPDDSGNTKVCHDCYVAFAKELIIAGLGTFNSGVITPAQPSIATKCGEISEAVARQTCYKQDAIVAALSAFHTCAGIDMNYPSNRPLSYRQADIFNGVYEYLVNAAFQSTGVDWKEDTYIESIILTGFPESVYPHQNTAALCFAVF